MTLPTRAAMHLFVLGVAFITIAVRPGQPSLAPGGGGTTTAAGAPAADVAYRPPALEQHPARSASHPARQHVARKPVTAPKARRAATPAHVARPAPRPTQRTPATHATPHRAATKPAPTATTATHKARSTHHVATASVPGPTSWSALNAAIAKIPTYRPGAARWVVSDKYGYWGTADWYDATLFVSPTVPDSYLYSVAVHEWSHELSVLDYNGDVAAAVKAMNANFGGGGATGLAGAERAADCMSLLQGATYTHYTKCENSTWRRLATRLVRGEQL